MLSVPVQASGAALESYEQVLQGRHQRPSPPSIPVDRRHHVDAIDIPPLEFESRFESGGVLALALVLVLALVARSNNDADTRAHTVQVHCLRGLVLHGGPRVILSVSLC